MAGSEEHGAISGPVGSAGAAPALYPIDHEPHLLDRLGVVFRHRRAAISVLLLVIIAAVLHTYTTVPMYKAQARLLIEDEHSGAIVAGLNGNTPDYWQDPEPYYQTQYRILTGRELASKVVRRLKLEQVPEFNGQGAKPTGLSGALAEARKRIETPVRALLNKPAPAERAPEPAAGVHEQALIHGFLSRVSVEPVRNSRLVDVSFQSADPAFAARAADALCEEYVQQNLDLKSQTSERSLAWLADELAKQQRKLEDSERAMALYREEQNALSLEERQNIVVARLNQLNDAVTKAKTVRVQKEALHNQVRGLGTGGAGADTFPAIAQNPFIQEHKRRVGELQRERARLSERYGEKHPEIVKVNASLHDAQQQLTNEIAKSVESIRNEYHSALAEERTLAAALEDQKGAAMDLNRKSVNYTVLERDARSNRQVYEMLLQREKEVRLASNSKANNVRLIDRAEPPKAPFSPNPRRNLFMAVVLGLAVGIGVAFGIDYLDDTIKTPEDITRKLKLPFLGLVPSVRGNRNPMLSGSVPHDFGEAFRSLRTSLVFTSGGQATRMILVTSAQPLEGKTTTTCNLAIALAYGGARVLVVDADMRRPSVHGALGLENETGLSNLLVGQARAREAIQRTSEPNLFAMTAGRIPPNPSELLASDRMKTLLASLGNGMFDWVIIDTPPILAVTDAVILTTAVSGVALVFGSEMTRRRHAERAIETLLTSRPRVLGAVLNRVDFARDKYYYSRYYGYHHKSYYAEAQAV